MMLEEDYFPKKFIEKGNKLLCGTYINGQGGDWCIKNYYTTEVTLEVVGESIATVNIRELPGCCGVVILTGLYITSKKRQKYGSLLIEAAMHIAANEGYTLAMATTATPASHALARSLGAQEVNSFRNRRTGHTVKVWTKTLPKAFYG